VEHALLTGLGLAAPAGLNAFLPLLILALADRLSSAITLQRPYDLLSSTPGIAVVIILLTIEVVVDKVPGLDHANDLIQSAIRPAAGAFLAMAAATALGPNGEAASLNPVLAMILGLVTAGSVHAAKATTRTAVTLGTGGILNPLVSVGEDLIAALAAVAALFAPLLAGLVLLGFVAFVVWALRRLQRLRAANLHLPNSTSTTLRR
jgi:hypothetical protein